MADPSCRTQLSDLPIDVLSSIADRILSFDGVIRSFADDGSSGSSRQLQKLRSSPWLVIEVNEATKILCFFSGRIFFPMYVQLPATRSAIHCIGSFFGWLFMADRFPTVGTDNNGGHYFNNYLLNPCTNQRIQLPRSSIGGPLAKVEMLDAESGLLAMTDRSLFLAFCRLGDSEWSLRDSPTRFAFKDIIFFKGVLYAVIDFRCRIMAIEGMQERILPIERHPKSKAILHGHYIRYFLVESDGELLLVVEEVEVSCRSPADHGDSCDCYDKGIRFCVLMLDFNGPSWVELTTLGNRMLLLDWTCSVSLDARKFTEFGFKPNCIYYSNHGAFDNHEWHEFCLEDNRIVPFGCDFLTLLPCLQLTKFALGSL